MVYLLHHLAGACLACTWCHRHCTEEYSVVFVGHKSGLGGGHGDHERRDAERHGDTGSDAMLEHLLYSVPILALYLVVLSVKSSMETVDDRHLLVFLVACMWLEEDGTEGWRKCQRVQGGDKDRHRHGDTKHTIEHTARTAHERHWHKHGSHYKRDGDDGSGNLVHGVDRGLKGRLITLVELRVYRLYHHDGVIDHDGDGEQEGREYKQVDGEAKQPEEEERTYKSHRHGDHWDERRAEVLQEHIHHEEDEQKGDDKGEHHLFDRGEEELGDVHVDLILHAWRERL